MFPILLGAMLATAAPTPRIAPLVIEEYQLDNGLSVILQPDPSERLVAVNLRYQVGSMHDPEDRAGLAHLVEHLMFLEKDPTRGSEFFARLEAAGATEINAYTTLDHTEYHELVAPEVLPLALWLEAERMDRLKDWITPERVERERRVVENELFERVYDRPYAFTSQLVFERLFPDPKHPLHFGPIGTREQLSAVTAEDVVTFHGEWYAPRNASLVLAGRFDPAEARALISQYFGVIAPRTEERAERSVMAPVFESRPIFAPEWVAVRPLLSLFYKLPKVEGPRQRSLEVLGAMMTYGQTSRAGIANLRDESIEGLAAGLMETPAGTLFRIDAIGTPGVLPLLVRNRMLSVLETYVGFAPMKEELDATKRRMRLDLLRALASLSTRASMLQSARARLGDPRAVLALPGQWDRVTGLDIQEELNKIMTSEPLFVVAQPIRRRR